MKLFSYFRSSAAYRVRIALSLKGLDYETVAVNLLAKEHKGADYLALNPQGRVPALEENDHFITQSPAILDYLEDTNPSTPLYPFDLVKKAHVRQFCNIIACDIHPLNNLSVMVYLKEKFGASQEGVNAWYAHWVQEGFKAAEAMIEGPEYCFGGEPTLAEAYLLPQMYNARRFNVDLSDFPKLVAIDAHCTALDIFKAAAPEQQPDSAL